MRQRRWITALLLAFSCGWLRAEPNPAAGRYVVLVSLDGFRYDYAKRYHATHLLAMRQEGAAADSMIPSFPSLTFPNHISIVTGLYPGHHGIVANNFYDPARNATYSNAKNGADGTWYRAKPLWVVAEEQNVKSACMFWPSSDAEIDGVRPSYWFKYDAQVSTQARVTRVLDWLKLPDPQRPHFITLYLSNADDAGHKFGPESKEIEQAVHEIDSAIGDLQGGIRSSGLPVDLIVVSDHGMQSMAGAVELNRYADLSKVRFMSGGPFALIYAPDTKTAEQVYRELKRKHGPYEVYRRKETPARWHYSQDPRAGDLVVIATRALRLVGEPPRGVPPKGAHGFDPALWKNMRAIFYATGPDIRARTRIKPFENVEVFALVAKILGLQAPPGLDGSGQLSGVCRLR